MPNPRKPRKHPIKNDAQLAAEERERNIRLGMSLIEKNARDYVICFMGWEGGWGFESSSVTYGLGAADRVKILLSKQVADEG
jgi:hypothetical protein